jgi:hypothetical protein
MNPAGRGFRTGSVIPKIFPEYPELADAVFGEFDSFLLILSSRHNMTPSILIIMRSFNAPHRTGLVDFPHPALQSNSLLR